MKDTSLLRKRGDYICVGIKVVAAISGHRNRTIRFLHRARPGNNNSEAKKGVNLFQISNF